MPPESIAGTVDGVGFAEVATVFGVVCGLVVDGGVGEASVVVVLVVISTRR